MSEHKTSSTFVTTSAANGWLRLAAACGALAVIWLVILPWLTRMPALARRIEWHESRGIDPSAMFYTELPMIHRILHDEESSETPRALTK